MMALSETVLGAITPPTTIRTVVASVAFVTRDGSAAMPG